MASSVTCPKCGETVTEGEPFCFQCGAPLRAAATGTVPPSSPPGEPPRTQAEVELFRSGAPDLSYERRRDVDRTKTGVLLLMIGALVSWIPVIGFLGGLLSLVGAILVILGRTAFGPAHARNVGIAVVLFIIGLVGGVVLAGGFLASVYSAVSLPQGQAGPALVAAFNGLLGGAVVLSLISGLASVFFLYELLNLEGRLLIWASYAAGVGIEVLVFAVVGAQVSRAISSAFAVSPPDPGPLVALDAQINSLRLLSALPSLLSAGAAYIAWSRIDRGMIPEKRFPTLPPR